MTLLLTPSPELLSDLVTNVFVPLPLLLDSGNFQCNLYNHIILHQTWNCFLDILRGLNIWAKSASMSLVKVTDLPLQTHHVMFVMVRRRFHAVVSTLQETDQPHRVKREKDKAIMILIN